MIVHLNGWPGVGKKTIGFELAKNLRARFIHNHLLQYLTVKVESETLSRRVGSVGERAEITNLADP